MKIKYVYHGSANKRKFSLPQRHRKIIKRYNKEPIIRYDKVSFHASDEYWVALSYTYKARTFKIKNRSIYFNISIDLYSTDKVIEIHGKKSLLYSLQKLYGDGGYIAYYHKHLFKRDNGLGILEVVTDCYIKSALVKKINDPVSELKKHGVRFEFKDLTLEENSSLRCFKAKPKD